MLNRTANNRSSSFGIITAPPVPVHIASHDKRREPRRLKESSKGTLIVLSVRVVRLRVEAIHGATDALEGEQDLDTSQLNR